MEGQASKSLNLVPGFQMGMGQNLFYIIIIIIIQGGAPKIAKLVYNSNNYGL